MAAKISLQMPKFARDANGTRTPAAEAAGVWLPALILFATFWALYRWTAHAVQYFRRRFRTPTRSGGSTPARTTRAGSSIRTISSLTRPPM